jgi:anti-sigma regulatory factor (Ser/Thr protein kinase)
VLIPNKPADRRPTWLSDGARDTRSTGGGSLHLELPMSADAPQMARSSLTAWAEDERVTGWRVDKLRLIASEVVTNAVRHSGADPDSTVHVAASRAGPDMLVTVTDSGERSRPTMREPDPQTGGYGLHIVSVEARSWGVERARGTRVWFTV